jgi:hypothetical protein
MNKQAGCIFSAVQICWWWVVLVTAVVAAIMVCSLNYTKQFQWSPAPPIYWTAFNRQLGQGGCELVVYIYIYIYIYIHTRSPFFPCRKSNSKTPSQKFLFLLKLSYSPMVTRRVVKFFVSSYMSYVTHLWSPLKPLRFWTYGKFVLTTFQ